jgi:hypothetical protein
MNPYVFFVGCPRSGTTLLRRIGDAHSELAVVRELHWLPSLWERRIGITPDGMVGPDLVDRLLDNPRLQLLELDTGEVTRLIRDGERKHYALLVSELFDLHGELKGKRHVGEKTPHYALHLPTLHSLWPHAKIVHLIRDGRDVALSVLDWSKREKTAGRFPTWREEPVATTALWWEWHVRVGREAAAFLGPERYLEVRYESLVGGPERECRRLCDFLALAYDPAMLRFHEGHTQAKPGLSAKKARLPVTAGLRSWREQMVPADVARFEAAAGPLLDELGYPRAVASVSREEFAHAGRLRKAFVAHARSRRRSVPEAWEVAA